MTESIKFDIKIWIVCQILSIQKYLQPRFSNPKVMFQSQQQMFYLCAQNHKIKLDCEESGNDFLKVIDFLFYIISEIFIRLVDKFIFRAKSGKVTIKKHKPYTTGKTMNISGKIPRPLWSCVLFSIYRGFIRTWTNTTDNKPECFFVFYMNSW